MWALTADADFLAQRGQGQVEQVFARAVNIALPARQQLLTLLCEEYDNAPNSCRLALTHFDDLFRHGDKVQFDDQGITVGQHLHIEMSRCRRWLSPTLQMTAVNFHLIAWLQWHDIIHQHLGENETLFNYRGDNPFYQALNKELHIKRRAEKGEIRRIKFKRVLLSDYRCYSQFIENSHKNQGNVNEYKKSTCRLFIGCTTG